MMAPRRKGPSLSIDRIFGGVGRIKKRSGTYTPAVKRKLERMLDGLYDEGRLDILRLIRDGKLTLLEVHHAYQRKALGQLPTGETVVPLTRAMQRWIDGLRVPADYSAGHVASLRTSLAYFTKANKRATLADLPRVLEKLRDTLGKEHPRSFNLARAAAMAFVRQTLKRNHPLWLAVAAVEPRKVGTTVQRRPLTPDEMRHWFPSPETDPLDAIAWGMATTGMHRSEYWGAWHVESDCVRIDGTKRKGRKRRVPLVHVPAVPAWHHPRTFEDKLRERTTLFTPYDLRRTYANWMEAAGIPRTRRRMYLGHGAKDVTDLYEEHEVRAYLAEDATKLTAYLAPKATKRKRLRVAK